MAEQSISKTLSLANQGKRYPIIKLVGDNPEYAALISKLTSPPISPNYNQSGNREIKTPNAGELRSISNRTSRNIADGQTVMQLLPDIELSAQILVSSILSPKDMMSTELTFHAPEGILNTAICAELLSHIRKHMEQVYKIKTKLAGILRDILFDKGSHAIAVLPESTIDEVINRHTAVTLESLTDLFDNKGQVRSLGLLGASDYEKNNNGSLTDKTQVRAGALSLEDFREYQFKKYEVGVFVQGRTALESIDMMVSVTDNIDILKFPQVQDKIRNQRIRQSIKNLNKLKTGLEHQINKPTQTTRKLTDRELTSAIYKRSSQIHEDVTVLKTEEQTVRKSIGEPLIMKLPSESVIPVHIPGQEERHVGYFVLLDIYGHPISNSARIDHYSEIANRMNNGSQSGSYPSTLINKVQQSINGFDCNNTEHLQYSVQVYGDMIEQDLLARLKNGIYTNGVALGRNDEIYRIMLARALSSKRTQLLFLPVELMTYFAFSYNGDGIGKSILDDMKIINSLRSILMFSNTMAATRNSVGQTNIRLKLDEDDPDPQKSIERAMHELIRAKSQAFPLAASNPVDMVNWLQRASIQFTFEGHPGIPDMQIEQTQGQTSYPMPDETLEENLRKRSIMATGLSPETVDNGFSGEFATSIVANNILLSRRVMQWQDKFCPLLSDHLQKVILASSDLIDTLRATIEANFDALKFDQEEVRRITGGASDTRRVMIDHVLSEFIRGLEVQLPRPNAVTLENQAEALENFKKVLDPMIDAFINEDFFTGDIVGENLSGLIGAAKNAVRSLFIRRFAAENGILPELFEIVTDNEDGHCKVNVWEEQKTHTELIMRSLTNLLKGLKPIQDATQTILDQSTNANTGGSDSYGGGSDYGSDTGSDGGESDDFGGDDFGGDDLSQDETQTEETTEEVTETTEESSTTTQSDSSTSENLNGESTAE